MISEPNSLEVLRREYESGCAECGALPDDCWGMHAACVEHKGGAHLFSAATHAGKSTLTAYLAMNGFKYLTDDKVIIRRADMRVLPFVTPLHLRPGGVEVLRTAGVSLPDLCPDRQCDADMGIRYILRPGHTVESPLPVDGIYFISRSSCNELLRVPSFEAIPLLLRSAAQAFPLSSEYLGWILKLAQAPCYELRYCNLMYPAEALRERAAATASGPAGR